MREKNDSSLYKVGGAGAILLGIFTLLGAITYLLLPTEQKLSAPGAQLLPSFAQNPTPLTLELWELALIGVFGIAVVPALSQIVRIGNEGWVRFTSNLAYLGFAVSAVSNVLILERLPKVAASFVAGDPSVKAALLPVWKSTLDPVALWGYGATGLWIFVISLLALRNNAFPKILAYLGLALGLIQCLIPLGLIFNIQPLFIVSVGVVGVISIIWYVWAGLVAWRTTSQAVSTGS